MGRPQLARFPVLAAKTRAISRPTRDIQLFWNDAKLYSHTISWIRVQSNRWVRSEPSWAGGREFHRGVLRDMLSMKRCCSLADHRVRPLGIAIRVQARPGRAMLQRARVVPNESVCRYLGLHFWALLGCVASFLRLTTETFSVAELRIRPSMRSVICFCSAAAGGTSKLLRWALVGTVLDGFARTLAQFSQNPAKKS